MRSVGSKAGLAGVARLVAVGLAMGLTTLHPAAASTSGNNEPDHYKGDPWNWPVLNTEELAQQDTTAPATPPATTAPATTPPATPPAIPPRTTSVSRSFPVRHRTRFGSPTLRPG